MKADLHMHGPIGFQPYWLKKQGYEGKNLLKEIADSCFQKNLDISVITSDEDDIPPGTIHDRFNYLKNTSALDLPTEYSFDSLGENVGIISKDKFKRVYLVNGQTVRTGPLGNTIDYLVIGANDVRNHRELGDTIKEVHEREDVFGGAEHGFCTSHGGMGLDNMINYMNNMTFIEGHNSQLILPSIFKNVPFLGQYSKESNRQAQELAYECSKPWIATSDAHRIEDAGLSYIEFNLEQIDDTSEESFINSLRTAIETNNFGIQCQYENPVDWVRWVSTLMIGQKLGRDK